MRNVTMKTFYEVDWDTDTVKRVEARRKTCWLYYKESEAYEALLNGARISKNSCERDIVRMKAAIQQAKKDIKKWAAKERALQFMVERLKLLEQQYEKPKRRKKDEHRSQMP